jgi:hypothetical protein
MGVLGTLAFLLLTGFFPSTPLPQSSGRYQFYKEQAVPGAWVFDPETGICKFFDTKEGLVIISSFQSENISVKHTREGQVTP